MSDFLQFEDVSKHYGAVKAVDHVSLSVKQGEFFLAAGAERLRQDDAAADPGGV
jgi:ABC-type Fe3+/spermidine/putrescine transport system ATPase subunit